MTDYETSPADSAYHRGLPIGERPSARPLIDDAMSCFDDVTLKALAPMLVPEKPRAGELDRAECGHCRPSEHTIWADDLWQVRAGWDRMGIPTSAASRRASTTASRTRHSLARCHFAR
jgi:hypothetical protein